VDNREAFLFYFIMAEISQMIRATITTTISIPTTTPALNMPVITEQLLRPTSAKASNKKLIFLIIRLNNTLGTKNLG
jgi:hypothetical protein